MIGTLLGKGYSIIDAMQELKGVTLESIVIASRTAMAIQALIAQGKVEATDFPLLQHIDAIIADHQNIHIPWEAFETEMWA